MFAEADDDGHALGALDHQDAIREAGAWAVNERQRLELGVAATPEVRTLTVADSTRAYIDMRGAPKSNHRPRRALAFDPACDR